MAAEREDLMQMMVMQEGEEDGQLNQTFGNESLENDDIIDMRKNKDRCGLKQASSSISHSSSSLSQY